MRKLLLIVAMSCVSMMAVADYKTDIQLGSIYEICARGEQSEVNKKYLYSVGDVFLVSAMDYKLTKHVAKDASAKIKQYRSFGPAWLLKTCKKLLGARL